MGKGKKMCKYKSFKQHTGFDRMLQKASLICSNTEVSKEHQMLVNKNQVYCSRRLCSFYESR